MAFLFDKNKIRARKPANRKASGVCYSAQTQGTLDVPVSALKLDDPQAVHVREALRQPQRG